MGDVRVGCSGWAYKEWRGVLYPEGLPQRRWLARYAESFDTVEINNTFYRLPSEAAVKGWIEQTPAGFAFAVKASRYLTHVKKLKGLAEYGRARLFNSLQAMTVSGKLGVVLWQLPPNFHRNDDRLASALSALPEGRHCFEFRHQSWFCDEVYKLLRSHDAALVIADDPEQPFQTQERTASWTYVRFHRGSRGRSGNYSRAELETWARRLAQWRGEVDVWAYFNNDQQGHAVRNASLLKRLLND
ncbi:MAG: DUF72 domain-containing protein [Solirubrobacterales bacterium]